MKEENEQMEIYPEGLQVLWQRPDSSLRSSTGCRLSKDIFFSVLKRIRKSNPRSYLLPLLGVFHTLTKRLQRSYQGVEESSFSSTHHSWLFWRYEVLPEISNYEKKNPRVIPFFKITESQGRALKEPFEFSASSLAGSLSLKWSYTVSMILIHWSFSS